MSRRPFRRFVIEGLLLVAIPLAVYVGSFAIHFRLLDHSGPDEVFMSRGFEQTLIGSAFYNPTVHFPLWRELRDVHHAIRVGNESLEHANHGGASRWYTWPIMKHPLGLWEPTPEPGRRTMIILVGNPVVWWGGLVGVLAGIAAFLVRRQWFAGREFGFLLLLGAVLLNFLPFAAIQRLMYIYHYLFALTFVIALAAFSCGAIAGWMNDDTPLWRFPSQRSAAIYFAIVGLLVVSFAYFLPFTYGWPMSAASWDAHFWVLHPHV